MPIKVLASTASFDWWSVFIFLKISCFLFLLLHNRLIVNETYLAIFTIKNDFFKENYYDNTFLVLFPTPSFKKLFWLQKCTFILLWFYKFYVSERNRNRYNKFYMSGGSKYYFSSYLILDNFLRKYFSQEPVLLH